MASFSFGGTLTPYAIGHMSGTTEEAGLTPNGIANSVWGKVIEAGFSADQILRILAAQAAGSATVLRQQPAIHRPGRYDGSHRR